MITKTKHKGIAPGRFMGFRIKVVENCGDMVRALILPHNILVVLPLSALDRSAA